MAAKKKATKTRRKPAAKYIWVSFLDDGRPNGVTKLEDEAEEWKKADVRVVRYLKFEKLK